MATNKVKNKKEKPAKQISHELTLDQYDDLTMENQVLGAGREREKIIFELARRSSQLRDFSIYSKLPAEDDQFMNHANGLDLAISIINNLRDYEDNVGCPECEAF